MKNTKKLFQSLGPGYAVQLEVHENIPNGLEIAAAGFLQLDEVQSLRTAIDIWLAQQSGAFPLADAATRSVDRVADRVVFAILNSIDVSEAWGAARRDPHALRNAAKHEIGKALEIADAARAFVEVHCQLEDLARREGAGRAAQSLLNKRVVDLHHALEKAVLGDAPVPGRRTKG